MKKLYYWSHSEMLFRAIPLKKYITTSSMIIGLLVISFFSGILTQLYLNNSKVNCITDNQLLTIGSQEWKDSVFTDYKQRAEIYLQKFPDTPIDAGMLKLAAYNAYDSTGILLPVELALAQGQLESTMGTKGRSPINNPYNVGEYDTKTVIWFDNTFAGIQAYYYLMCRDYLKCKSVNTLLKSFRNCNGNRYASKPTYETELARQMNYIKKYTDNAINKQKEKNTHN
jgi:hypothetical protein